MSNPQLFEHPLNERVRTFLRLEHLFEKVNYFAPLREPWDTRAAVDALLEIIAITARADIKTELLKEIDRNLSTLMRIGNQPGVDQGALKQIMAELEQAAGDIHELSGPIASDAREDPLLKAIAQRSAIPGGACSFDVPLFHHLLIQSPERRSARLQDWLTPMAPVHKAVALLLSLARTSARPRTLTAEQGFFQEALDVQAPALMIRVGLSSELGLFPEISGHKNRFSIRFMHADGGGSRSSQSREDVPFQLTCCIF
ncbi:cell division protein ZapD [Thiohalocapsa marina]|uniref:cell division protein ZapD n=1 Tax=Thiohalocapsa marina TaxID=424902 RepID=UPI0036DC8DB5